MRALPTELRCEHPKAMTAGVCVRPSIGTYDIPDTYVPEKRHLATPDIPRGRKLRLCQQHLAMVNNHITGKGSDAGGHIAQCKVCQHPEGKRLSRLWTEWVLSSQEVIEELRASGVAAMSWYRHCEYFNLADKKAQKVNTKRALTIAAEKGFGAGGHSVRTALTALQLLAKERGDVDEHRHTVTGIIGTVDLTKLTEKQLAQMAAKLETEFLNQADDQLALSGDIDTIDGEVIDEPVTTTVRERVGKGRGK